MKEYTQCKIIELILKTSYKHICNHFYEKERNKIKLSSILLRYEFGVDILSNNIEKLSAEFLNQLYGYEDKTFSVLRKIVKKKNRNLNFLFQL